MQTVGRRKRKERILIVDGFALERASMKALLATNHKIDDVREAGDLGEAKEYLEKQTFDLIIYSLLTFEEEEIRFLKKIIQLADDKPVMILGPEQAEEHVFKLVQAGIYGYITKQEGKDVLLEGVRSLLDGNKFFSISEPENLEQHIKAGKKSAISEREKEILRLVIGGMNNIRIGETLNISVRTVENHRANMMRKLSVKNTAELVKKAITDKLVDF